jgi:hypothetical protein
VKTNPDFKRVQPLPVVPVSFAPIAGDPTERFSQSAPPQTSLHPPMNGREGFASSVRPRLNPPVTRALN